MPHTGTSVITLLSARDQRLTVGGSARGATTCVDAVRSDRGADPDRICHELAGVPVRRCKHRRRALPAGLTLAGALPLRRVCMMSTDARAGAAGLGCDQMDAFRTPCNASLTALRSGPRNVSLYAVCCGLGSAGVLLDTEGWPSG